MAHTKKMTFKQASQLISISVQTEAANCHVVFDSNVATLAGSAATSMTSIMSNTNAKNHAIKKSRDANTNAFKRALTSPNATSAACWLKKQSPNAATKSNSDAIKPQKELTALLLVLNS